MILTVTNPGANLTADQQKRYGIKLTPQRINVDGVPHDTRTIASLETIDEWVKTAKTHPFVLGTSAPEFAALFREVSDEFPEILAVMTSRKIIGSHDAALAAVETLKTVPSPPKVTVDVVDSLTTDVGCGLVALYCAASAQEGRRLPEIAAAARKLATGGASVFVPQTLENLVKGGRATFLKAWIAEVLKVLPLIAFVDGELKSVGKVSRRTDAGSAITEHLVTKVGAKRAVWIGIAHGGNAFGAMALAGRLRERFDVRFLYAQPLSPSIYLHGGPGALFACVLPVDDLPWIPRVT